MRCFPLPIAVVLGGLAAATGLCAQPNPPMAPRSSIEQVIVTAPKIDSPVTANAIAHQFIGSYAMPSLLLGSIPRWHARICLEIRGMRSDYAPVVEQRVRAIAAQVGAPMADKGCKPNLSITFTPEPQKLLDNIKARNSAALGYHGATQVSHAIQAWYETGTTDMLGHTMLDQETFVAWDSSTPFNPASFKYTSPTPIAQVEGMPGRSGLTSDFVSVFLIVDTKQTSDYEVVTIADYAAMLALSQTQDYDSCENVPSIANLFSPTCPDNLKPEIATPGDIAYLRGVYRMDAGASLKVQQDQIAGEMAKTLLSGK